MTNRALFVRLSLVTALIASCACSREEGVVQIGERSISKSEFEAYLKHKHIAAADEKKLERTLDEYSQRSALAAAIEGEKLLDHEELQVELDELKKEILISRYFEKLLADRVSDQAVRNYYESNRKTYEEKKAHVAHILLRTSPAMSETERKIRDTRIQEAHAKVRAGEDFGKIADAYSEDRISSVKGGDIGWIKEGAVDPKFSEIAFKLSPGEISQPFASQFGFQIVKLLEGPTMMTRPFESVAGDIRYQLRQEVKDAELKRLTAKVKVEKNSSVLKTVKVGTKSARSDTHAQN